MTRFPLALLALTALVSALVFAVTVPQNAAAAKPPKRVLVVTVTKGYRHDSIPMAETTLQSLADDSKKFTVDYARTDADLQAKMSVDGLKKYDAVVFANTTGDLPLPDKAAFLNWIRAGHGFIGAHAASDTFHGDTAYYGMLGGEFLTHGAQVNVTARIADDKHPSTKVFAGKSFDVFEEIYEFQHYDRAKVHLLLAMDAHPQTKAAGEFPLAWCKTEGKGRVFYTALGHRKDVWQAPWFRAHLLGGVLWSLGLEKGDATTPAESH